MDFLFESIPLSIYFYLNQFLFVFILHLNQFLLVGQAGLYLIPICLSFIRFKSIFNFCGPNQLFFCFQGWNHLCFSLLFLSMNRIFNDQSFEKVFLFF